MDCFVASLLAMTWLRFLGGGGRGCRPFFVGRARSRSLQRLLLTGTSGLPGHFTGVENAAMSYLLVFFGGGLGATLRHLINVTCARCMGTGFPWGTFIINITGSTVMGLIAGYLAFKGEASQPWRLFLMTGILGGYTTFSAYSLDAALLYERGALGLAALYVIGSVVLSIAGLFAGLALVRHFT
jgi:fluoride exporter